MDYRSTIADDDHPAGASPWGSSPPASPRRNETGYSALGSEATHQYVPQDTSNGPEHDDLTANAFKRPETANSDASQSEFDPSQQSETSQQSEFGGPLDTSSHQQHPQYDHGASQQSQAQEQHFAGGAPAGQEQQTRRATYAQYKLQAKITGLERTGRKDPILRFDVHVSCPKRNRKHGIQYSYDL
jgi:hypothetical protein